MHSPRLTPSTPVEPCQCVRQFTLAIMGEFPEASCADRSPERAFTASIPAAALGVSIDQPRALCLAELSYGGGGRVSRADASLTVERADERLIRAIKADIGAGQPGHEAPPLIRGGG